MDTLAKQNLIKSYQTNAGFIVHDCQMLAKLYCSLGINPQASHDSRIFELEGVSHFFQSGVIALARKLHVCSNDYVLCPGDGSGAPSRLLAKLFGVHVTGVDINPNQIEKARQCASLHALNARVEYVEQNVEELSLDKKDYDVIFCNETCCHWQNKMDAFAKLFAHLKNGGKIGFNAWLRGDKGTLSDAYNCIPEFKVLYQKGIWFQEDLFSYEQLLQNAGFKVLKMNDCTSTVDIRIRARIRAHQQWERYEKVMGKEAKESAVSYYQGMLKTHYDFLRYGLIIACKK